MRINPQDPLMLGFKSDPSWSRACGVSFRCWMIQQAAIHNGAIVRDRSTLSWQSGSTIDVGGFFLSVVIIVIICVYQWYYLPSVPTLWHSTEVKNLAPKNCRRGMKLAENILVSWIAVFAILWSINTAKTNSWLLFCCNIIKYLWNIPSDNGPRCAHVVSGHSRCHQCQSSLYPVSRGDKIYALVSCFNFLTPVK